jgi:hypothetical protein
MRFRPANISLINRRHYLPRLLLTLSSKYDDKNNPSDLQMLTGSHHINFRIAHKPGMIVFAGLRQATSVGLYFSNQVRRYSKSCAAHTSEIWCCSS